MAGSYEVRGPLPTSLSIGRLDDPRLRLTAPIPVRVEEDGLGNVVLWSDDLDEFGVGETLDAAMDDFRSTVVALYFLLREDEARLGPGPRGHWEFARRVMTDEPR